MCFWLASGWQPTLLSPPWVNSGYFSLCSRRVRWARSQWGLQALRSGYVFHHTPNWAVCSSPQSPAGKLPKSLPACTTIVSHLPCSKGDHVDSFLYWHPPLPQELKDIWECWPKSLLPLQPHDSSPWKLVPSLSPKWKCTMTLCFWLSLKSNWSPPSVTQRIKVTRLYILPLAFPSFSIFFLQVTRDQKRWVFNFLSLSGWDLLYVLDSLFPMILSSIYPSLASNGRMILYGGDVCGIPRFGSFTISSRSPSYNSSFWSSRQRQRRK